MNTTAKKRGTTKSESFNSFEEWSVAFLPRGVDTAANESDFDNSPSEVGKMIASATLQRIASLSGNGRKQTKASK